MMIWNLLQRLLDHPHWKQRLTILKVILRSPVDNPSLPMDDASPQKLPPTDHAIPPASLPPGKQKALPIGNPEKKKRKLVSIPLKETHWYGVGAPGKLARFGTYRWAASAAFRGGFLKCFCAHHVSMVAGGEIHQQHDNSLPRMLPQYSVRPSSNNQGH